MYLLLLQFSFIICHIIIIMDVKVSILSLFLLIKVTWGLEWMNPIYINSFWKNWSDIEYRKLFEYQIVLALDIQKGFWVRLSLDIVVRATHTIVFQLGTSTYYTFLLLPTYQNYYDTLPLMWALWYDHRMVNVITSCLTLVKMHHSWVVWLTWI